MVNHYNHGQPNHTVSINSVSKTMILSQVISNTTMQLVKELKIIQAVMKEKIISNHSNHKLILLHILLKKFKEKILKDWRLLWDKIYKLIVMHVFICYPLSLWQSRLCWRLFSLKWLRNICITGSICEKEWLWIIFVKFYWLNYLMHIQ